MRRTCKRFTRDEIRTSSTVENDQGVNFTEGGREGDFVRAPMLMRVAKEMGK